MGLSQGRGRASTAGQRVGCERRSVPMKDRGGPWYPGDHYTGYLSVLNDH